MIEDVARTAVDRMLTRLEEAAADELPRDVRIEREGDRIVLIGSRVRLRALTEAWFIGLFGSAGR